jgi:MarR family transcriptional regulator for hemolysin
MTCAGEAVKLVKSALGKPINAAARATRALLDARLAAAGLSFSSYVVLFTLKENGPMIQREIAERLAIEGPSVVRQIGQLEAAGRIERLPLASDRRAAAIRLTQAGEALFDQVYGDILATEADLTAGISAADVATMLRVLEAVTERARRLRG